MEGTSSKTKSSPTIKTSFEVIDPPNTIKNYNFNLNRNIDKFNNVFFNFFSTKNDYQPLNHSFTYKNLLTRWIKFFVSIYLLFSIFFTIIHLFSKLIPNITFNNGSVQPIDLKYKHPADSDDSYSLLSDVPAQLRMSKLFSRSHYESLNNIQPYWKKASIVPNSDNVTIIATTTPSTWKDLVHIARNWEAPISTTLHVTTAEREKVTEELERDYESKPELYRYVDIHLIETKNGTDKRSSVLLPNTVEKNIARMYARTDYVSDIPMDAFIASRLHESLNKNKKKWLPLLNQGDIFVIPTFVFDETLGMRSYPIPNTKLDLIEFKKIFKLYDTNYELDQGPTNYTQWEKAKNLYTLSEYRTDYEPVTIQSKTVQPWCSERFVNRRSACILSSYLAGNDIYILSEDFIIKKPKFVNTLPETSLTDLDRVIEKRLYSKFYWEQCVYYGRQLDSMGTWDTPLSTHVRDQCSRIIQNWGTGLIGQAE